MKLDVDRIFLKALELISLPFTEEHALNGE
jgi:hypothetical protein